MAPLFHSRPLLLATVIVSSATACTGTVLTEPGGTGGTTSSGSSSEASGGASATSSGSGSTSSGSAGGSGGQPGAPDPIVSATTDSVYETRTDIKIGDGGLLVIAWVGHPAGQPSYIGYTFSTDAGTTFTPPARVDAPDGRAADHPTLSITATNDVFLSWLGYVQGANDTHVYVARAPVGQTSFEPPVEISAPAGAAHYDRPRLGITAKGTLIDVYERRSATEEAIVACRSIDGQTWIESDLPLNDYFGNAGQRPYPCSLAAGAPGSSRFGVAMLGQDLGGIAGGVGLLLSDDDGLTWSNDVDFADAASVSGPRCVTSGANWWLAYGFGSNTFGVNLLPMENEAVFVRINHNGGLYSDSIFQQTAKAYMLNPELLVDANDQPELVYYAGQVDGDPAATYRLTRSDGSPVGSSSPLVAQPVTFAIGDPSASNWLGDYTGFASHGNVTATSYVDNASGTSHIAFHRISLGN